VGKPEGRGPLARPRCRWVDIRMYLQEVGCGYMDWIGLAQDRDRWRTLVSAVMNTLQSSLIINTTRMTKLMIDFEVQAHVETGDGINFSNIPRIFVEIMYNLVQNQSCKGF